MEKFRLLHADEIECRVNQCNAKGYSLLLYKDARCDMNILDETVGEMNWQRHHELINGKEFCTVSIYCDNGLWVAKQDCGTKSYTEAEKGESSDAFKRACVNWGIGRELYTAPFIWIQGGVKAHATKANTYIPTDKVQNFRVAQIDCDDKRRITGLTIVNGNGEPIFSYGSKMSSKSKGKESTSFNAGGQTERNPDISPEMVGELIYMADQTGTSLEAILTAYGVTNAYHMTLAQYDNAIKTLKVKQGKMKAKATDPEAELNDMLDPDGVPQ